MADNGGSGDPPSDWKGDAEDLLSAGRAAHGLATRGSESKTKWVLILGGLAVLYIAGFTILGMALEHPLNGALAAIALAPAVLLAYYYMYRRYATSLFDIGAIFKAFLKGMGVSVPAVLVEVGLLLFVMTYIFPDHIRGDSSSSSASGSGSGFGSGSASGSSISSSGSGSGSGAGSLHVVGHDDDGVITETQGMYETQVIFAFFFAYFVASVVGEGLKYAVISSASKLFQEPFEVVVYGCAAALGFATMEQGLTVFAGMDARIPVQNKFVLGLIKGILVVPMHTVCGLWTSVGIARRIFYYDHMPFFKVTAIPIVIHGTFTFTLVAFLHTHFEILGLALVAAFNALAYFALHRYLLPSLGEKVPPELVI